MSTELPDADPVTPADAAALARGLLEIAELAMPDTYFATDSRCQHARMVLTSWEAMRRWSWTPPPEPPPQVRRVRPVERYAGDNAIWFDREPDDGGWRLVMHARAGEVIEWGQVVAAAGSVYGCRRLVDATEDLPGSTWPSST